MEQEATNPSPNSIQAQIEYLDRVVASQPNQSQILRNTWWSVPDNHQPGDIVTINTTDGLYQPINQRYYMGNDPISIEDSDGTSSNYFVTTGVAGRKALEKAMSDYVQELGMTFKKESKPYSVLDNIKLIK